MLSQKFYYSVKNAAVSKNETSAMKRLSDVFYFPGCRTNRSINQLVKGNQKAEEKEER